MLPGSLSIKEANAYLAIPEHYSTDEEAMELAQLLDANAVGGGVVAVIKVTGGGDSFYQLTLPTDDHAIHVVLLANNNSVIAGHIYGPLAEQPRWLWNLPFVGKMRKLKKVAGDVNSPGKTFSLDGVSSNDAGEPTNQSAS